MFFNAFLFCVCRRVQLFIYMQAQESFKTQILHLNGRNWTSKLARCVTHLFWVFLVSAVMWRTYYRLPLTLDPKTLPWYCQTVSWPICSITNKGHIKNACQHSCCLSLLQWVFWVLENGCFGWLQFEVLLQPTLPLDEAVNINAVWANLIVEECCRLGVTVCVPCTLNWMNTHF
jgi:hypothetical protein